MPPVRPIVQVRPRFTAGPVLGSILCTPATAVVGQSVCVEVRAPDGKPYDNHDPVPISINGVPGSKLFFAWPAAGSQPLIALAHGREEVEKLTGSIEIAPRPAGDRPPALEVRWSPDRSTSVELGIVNAPPPRSRVRPAPKLDASTLRQAAVARQRLRVSMRPAATGGARPVPRPPRRISGGTAPPTYTWDFGDGTSLSTVRPGIGHDYGPSLEPNRLRQVFHVTATVHRDGEPPLVLKRSLVVTNTYALVKRRRRMLQPPVVESTPSASFKKGAYRARVTVRNPEGVDVTLTHRRIERFRDDTARDAELLGLERARVVLRARSETSFDVVVPKAFLPDEVISFAAHYLGTGPGGLPVRVSAYFDLPEHAPTRWFVRGPLRDTFAEAVKRRLVDDPRVVSRRDLARLEGLRLASSSALADALQGPAMHTLDHQTPKKAIGGERCDPWNEPDVVPTGLFCMPTAEKETVLMPPRFMNARKGDIVLSPGTGGLIAELMAAVSPPQFYSHSGIMTRNRDEITHSTAAESRITDPTFTGGDGIRPDVLKYLWPGAITQTVDQAVHGQDFVDPETGKTYNIRGFPTILSGLMSDKVVPALVVKPDPLLETPEVRAKLHEIGDFAAQQEGKSHYRFFCYTDPAIGLTATAPAEAKWAAGTFPTVCSSLIWMAIRQAGVAFEGGLEQEDMDAGAQITPTTPDGLYLYSAAERLAAGEVLFSLLMGMLNVVISDVEDALTDAREDIANQIVNTFASDWSATEAKDSDKWRQTSDANAISADDLMFYDKPHYGFVEPLIFRDTRLEEVTVYRWSEVGPTGTITGLVRFQGKPVGGADAQLTESHATHTAADGTFTLTNVPVGDNIVEAQKEHDGVLLTAQAKVAVAEGETAQVTIDLQAPSHVFRRLHVEGWMLVSDYEFAAAVDPWSYGDINGFADLDPGTATHAVRTFDHVTDDAYGRLTLTFDLRTDDSVEVNARIRVYHEDNASNNDFDEASLQPFVVKAGGSWSGWMYLGELHDTDYAEAHFTVANRTNQS
jgi:hypothetical protein